MKQLTARQCIRLAITAALAIAAAVPWLGRANAEETGNAAPLATKSPAAKTQADAASSFDAKFYAAVNSDYNYRGYTLSNHLPSVSSNLEATYLVFFASVNTASVQIPGLSHFQMTDTIGLRPVPWSRAAPRCRILRRSQRVAKGLPPRLPVRP